MVSSKQEKNMKTTKEKIETLIAEEIQGLIRERKPVGHGNLVPTSRKTRPCE
jgi:hypothetical protein